jgi:predicted RND superfamily exporter protein
MWYAIADFIVRYRMPALATMISAAVLGLYYSVSRLEISQEMVRVIPESDPDIVRYLQFKRLFGEDGNTLIIALEAPEADRWYERPTLAALYEATAAAEKVPGVTRVINLARLRALVVQDDQFKFVFPFPAPPENPDSLRRLVEHLPFYSNLLYDTTGRTMVALISFSDSALKTKLKQTSVWGVMTVFRDFAQSQNMKFYAAGLPYFRVFMSKMLPRELLLFLFLALFLTAGVLYAFYRSFYAVAFPLLLLSVCTAVTLAIIAALGYKLTLLMATLPPIVVVLGVPPCIYMLGDYHAEYRRTGDKIGAIREMVHKLGLVTMMINANNAFGYVTLYLTGVTMLMEFGVVAFWSTCATYVITLVMLPGIFSLLPPPTDKNLRHLDAPVVTRFVVKADQIVAQNRRAIYVVSAVIFIVSMAGVFKLQAVSYMLDDVPKSDKIYTDIRHIESLFNGAMPFEIVVEAEKKGAFQKYRYLKLLNDLQQTLEKYPELSRSLSLADGLKWSRQALAGGDPSAYRFPEQNEMDFIRKLAAAGRRKDVEKDPLAAMCDSTFRVARVSCFVQDLGSRKMPELLDKVHADIEATLKPEKNGLTYYVTGTTRVFLRSNDYLNDNLVWSLATTFFLIGIQMWMLFGSARIMLVSLVPNLLPLAMTAGMMGYLDVPLKPATALIYQLAFGVAIDNSIHYLASYRYERKRGLKVSPAASVSLRLTGMAIVYTSLVLFAGFGVFLPSSFDSTRSLGLLTSFTLFTAMFSNLFLMPALVRDLDRDEPVRQQAWIDAS